MWPFFIRFSLFIGIWGVLLLQSSRPSFSLFLLAASLACFFFLSSRSSSIYLYSILICILSIHGYFIHDIFYTALLLLLIMTMASYRLGGPPLYVLLFSTVTIVAGLSLHIGTEVLPAIFLSTVFSFFLVQLSRNKQHVMEQKELYQNVLAEYRQLKRLHISTEEMAKSEERTRIAREIHDSVGHRLTALMMKIEMLYIDQQNESLLELKEMADAGLQETREAVKALQISETTGIHAIVQLIRKLEAESQLLIEFTLKEGVLTISLTNEQGIVLYRVIQEALTNVMRHGSSKQVYIEIGKAAVNGLSFSVKNPFIRQKQLIEGFGIINMEARMKELGGKLDVYQTADDFIVKGFMPFEMEGKQHVADAYRR